MPKPKAKTIDQYLGALSDDQRAALQRLRKIIQAVVPRAEECISYQLPAFRLDGKMLVWFGAAANHCAFYPGAVVEAYKSDLGEFQTSKGTVRFQPAAPLPATLVRKLVKARMAAIAAQQAAAAGGGRTEAPGQAKKSARGAKREKNAEGKPGRVHRG